MSQFQWAIVRRVLFVVSLTWLFAMVSWAMIPMPEILAIAVLIALIGAYVYTVTKWKLPKSPFSDNIAHHSHPSNIALKEAFVSVAIALPVLLALAWFFYQTA